jgi:5-methyltetrahydrofolate--homocysteine methyltransferase
METGKKLVYDPLSEFMRHYAESDAPAQQRPSAAPQNVEERLHRRIVDGDHNGIGPDLDAALARHSAVEIINGILLPAMKTVGELFGAGEMQLPFVLQSAESMKAAVSYLEPFMDRVDDVGKGVIVLATVRGDVHDIGKNLVDIILTNNGYKVVNLGIKVPVEAMLDAAQEHKADAIGMSGLLVKSTLIMKENLSVMEHRGLKTPVVLGGAALTRRFVEQDLTSVYSGKLAYANDAFDGLAFMEDLHALKSGIPDAGGVESSERRIPIGSSNICAKSALRGAGKVQVRPDVETGISSNDPPPVEPRSSIRCDVPIPVPPFLGSRVAVDIRLDEIYPFINEVALIRGQWQIRRGKRSETEYEEMLERDARPVLESLKKRSRDEEILKPAVVYGYFPCNADGDDLIIHRPKDLPDAELAGEWPRIRYERGELAEWARFSFPRQAGDRRLCLADYFRPMVSDQTDVCAFHVATVGSAVTAYAAELFSRNLYQDYLYMHGFGVECAEALAEYWHKRVRLELGIASGDAVEMRRLFSQGYQGARYSFGYPACPKLEDQRKLFTLLRPERIGVSLTEEYQLVPEQSTSAVIVHHPEARYFNIRDI